MPPTEIYNQCPPNPLILMHVFPPIHIIYIHVSKLDFVSAISAYKTKPQNASIYVQREHILYMHT